MSRIILQTEVDHLLKWYVSENFQSCSRHEVIFPQSFNFSSSMDVAKLGVAVNESSLEQLQWQGSPTHALIWQDLACHKLMQVLEHL